MFTPATGGTNEAPEEQEEEEEEEEEVETAGAPRGVRKACADTGALRSETVSAGALSDGALPRVTGPLALGCARSVAVAVSVSVSGSSLIG